MIRLSQSPLDPAFVADPYPFYDHARAAGPAVFWEDYGMAAVFDAHRVQGLLKDRRLGRAIPAPLVRPYPPHLEDWGALEDTSMLGMEPPNHTRLRALVLRAFTSRRVGALAPEIAGVTQELLANLPQDGSVDLIPTFCIPLPVRIIARLLGVPEETWPDLLAWSNAMVAMYQAGRTRAVEEAANAAARAFTAFLRDHIAAKRKSPADDLISELIAARDEGDRLSEAELIGTCVLLLNAGHEATVHSIGNAVACLLHHRTAPEMLGPEQVGATVEELLRFDPPLHMFTRYAYEDIEIGGLHLKKNEEVALILGAAGRDPAAFDMPNVFNPLRPVKPHAAFGGGLHFCVGAPLARLELQIALPALFAHLPNMTLTEPPRHAMTYHFRRLERLMVTR